MADESAAFLPAGTLESFRADLGLTYAQAGTVLAAVAPGALAGAGFAAAADRFSRRVIAAGGALGFAAALAAFGLGGSFAVLLAAAFVMGCASTAMVDAAEVALVDLVEQDLRRFLSRSNLLATIGDLIGPALIAVVAAAGLSWRAAFLIGAGLMALYGAALAAVPLPPPRRGSGGGEEDEEEDKEPRSSVRAALRDPTVWILGLMGLLMGSFDEPLVGFTIALLEQERAASTVAATVVAFVGVSGGLLAYSVLARRLEGASDHHVLLGGLTMVTLGAVAIATLPSIAAIAVASFVASVGLSIAWLALQHRQLTVRPGQVGATKAVLGIIEFWGFWIPVAIGALADAAGLRVAVGAYGALGIALILLARASSARPGAR